MCSYLPEAVKKVGLWDERFCVIGVHEGDYFLRQKLFNPLCSSINDLSHGRMYNPSYIEIIPHSGCRDLSTPICKLPIFTDGRKLEQGKMLLARGIAHNLFKKKFPYHLNCSGSWHKQTFINKLKTRLMWKIKNYKQPILYPYFEKDCDYYSTPKYRKLRRFFSVAK